MLRKWKAGLVLLGALLAPQLSFADDTTVNPAMDADLSAFRDFVKSGSALPSASSNTLSNTRNAVRSNPGNTNTSNTSNPTNPAKTKGYNQQGSNYTPSNSGSVNNGSNPGGPSGCTTVNGCNPGGGSTSP